MISSGGNKNVPLDRMKLSDLPDVAGTGYDDVSSPLAGRKGAADGHDDDACDGAKEAERCDETGE